MASGFLRKIFLFLGSLNRLCRLQRGDMVAYNEGVVECILYIQAAKREEYMYVRCAC